MKNWEKGLIKGVNRAPDVIMELADALSLVEGASPKSKSRALVRVVRHSVGPLALQAKRHQGDPSRVTIQTPKEAAPVTNEHLEGLVDGVADEASLQIGKSHPTKETQTRGDQDEGEAILHWRRASCDQLHVHDPDPTNLLQGDQKRQSVRAISNQGRRGGEQQPGKPLNRDHFISSDRSLPIVLSRLWYLSPCIRAL
ncbi:uncharacterized protein LOC143177099 isoform X1 [Calliopsis andreniformis]|uniref:uncharacterized protein LOC143177099 isoform X1 n=1 Tax=Calliopsis andreniformis TaxID=337506 RepID=UPI003FCC7FA2